MADIGFDAITAANDIYFLPSDSFRRLGIPHDSCMSLLVGELLRNYVPDQSFVSLWPYFGVKALPKVISSTKSYLLPFRSFLEIRSQFHRHSWRLDWSGSSFESITAAR